MTALFLSSAVYGQEYQVVDSTFTHTKLDQDSLYYDEMAYLDDYHFLFYPFHIYLSILFLRLVYLNFLK